MAKNPQPVVMARHALLFQRFGRLDEDFEPLLVGALDIAPPVGGTVSST